MTSKDEADSLVCDFVEIPIVYSQLARNFRLKLALIDAMQAARRPSDSEPTRPLVIIKSPNAVVDISQAERESSLFAVDCQGPKTQSEKTISEAN
jgi:hypothetical protein